MVFIAAPQARPLPAVIFNSPPGGEFSFPWSGWDWGFIVFPTAPHPALRAPLSKREGFSEDNSLLIRRFFPSLVERRPGGEVLFAVQSPSICGSKTVAFAVAVLCVSGAPGQAWSILWNEKDDDPVIGRSGQRPEFRFGHGLALGRHLFLPLG